MKTIITGGTGLIGQYLVRQMVADNEDVVVLSRSPESKRDTLPLSVPIRKWDGKSTDGWLDLCEGDYAIVNLAGTNIAGEGFPPDRWTAARKRSILDSRLNAGAAVVEAVEKGSAPPKVIIQSSAVGYYGDTKDKIATEESPAGPDDDFSAFVSKKWEEAIHPATDMGVRTCIIRTGIVLSVDGGALPRQMIPFKMFSGGPIGSGKQYYPWIHIADEARAIRYLMGNEGSSGPYNLTAPNPVTNAAFSKALGQVMNRPWFVPAPAPALRLMMGEVADIVLYGQRAVPEKLTQEGFTFLFSDPKPALEDLLSKSKASSATMAAAS